MKLSTDIVKYGRVKAYNDDKLYQFNTIDLETIDNELFLIGTHNREYSYTLDNFYNYLNDFFIASIQRNRDILSWSRYDNTFIIKTLLERLGEDEKRNILERIGIVTPLFTYEYKTFTIEVTNVIKENIILTITDQDKHKKRLTLYNLKNLFNTDLVGATSDYKLTYYSKMGEEFHKIDRTRFYEDLTYQKGVIESNRLDNIVLIDLAEKLLNNFKAIAGVYPKTMYTAGSLARSYLLTIKNINFNFHSLFAKCVDYDTLLDYSMKSYHGGKIESYVLGSIPKAKIIDISSAYPYALSKLPKLTKKVIKSHDISKLNDYFYAFINCTIHHIPETLIHPVTIPSPINSTNISPCGSFHAIITKVEYDYLRRHGVTITVKDYMAIKHVDGVYPYKDMIQSLFDSRLENKKNNPSLAALYKLILNSLYGITYELTDVYEEVGLDINWKGYRAGDFFNPVIASYITSMTRSYLSEVSNHIVENGGRVYLNMTDSIIYDGEVKLDVFSKKKTLGKFEYPEEIKDLIILGAGRYEYMDEFTAKYTIKSRGFSVKVKDKAFYKDLDLDDTVTIAHKTLVTFFRATTNKYSLQQLGHLVDDDYVINPLNLGGKRIIDNLDVNLKKAYTTTRPVRLYEDIV